MFAGGQMDLARGADNGGKRPVTSDTRGDIFLRQFKETKNVFGISFRDGGVLWPRSLPIWP